MNAVTSLIPWTKLQGYLPTIFQDINTSEVLAVTRTTEDTFRDLMHRWPLRAILEDPNDCADPIMQELYLDCDADCLLIKVTANAAWKTEFREYFHPLGREVPQELVQGTRLVLAVAQDAERKAVLMAAYMNEEALKLTLATGLLHYYSRSKRRIWKKGEESGHIQHLIDGRFDEKAHALVLNIHQDGGAACHEGYRSCFFRRIEPDGSLAIVGERVFDPKQVYKTKGDR